MYYYGARYYDPKGSLWVSPDPIFDDYLSGSSNGGVYNSLNLNAYAYAHHNPVKYIGPDGAYPNKAQAGNLKQLVSIVQNIESNKSNISRSEVFTKVHSHFTSGPGAGNKGFRYVYTKKHGWIDLKHFFETAKYRHKYGDKITRLLGVALEGDQEYGIWNDKQPASAFSPEDLPSNRAGAIFGDDVMNIDEGKGNKLSKQVGDYLKSLDVKDIKDIKGTNDYDALPDKEIHDGTNPLESNYFNSAKPRIEERKNK